MVQTSCFNRLNNGTTVDKMLQLLYLVIIPLVTCSNSSGCSRGLINCQTQLTCGVSGNCTRNSNRNNTLSLSSQLTGDGIDIINTSGVAHSNESDTLDFVLFVVASAISAFMLVSINVALLYVYFKNRKRRRIVVSESNSPSGSQNTTLCGSEDC